MVGLVQTRTRHDDLLPQRVWTLRKGTREAAIDAPMAGFPPGRRADSAPSPQLVSKIGVGNFRAVMILLDALQKLGIKDIATLKKTPPVALAAIRGVGVTTLFVLMSLLDGEGVDVKDWYSDTRTFTSVKKEQERVKADVKKEQRAEKRRRRTIEKPV